MYVGEMEVILLREAIGAGGRRDSAIEKIKVLSFVQTATQ